MKDVRRILEVKYGIEVGELDSNGYGRSLLHDPVDCYICHSPNIARHETMYGYADRQKSKALGLWVALCPEHHDQAHKDNETRIGLKEISQYELDKEYGEGTFFRVYGRNYL